MFELSKINAKTMHKMCLRKRRFLSEQYAKKIAKLKAEEFNCKNYVYFCSLCGGWHIATKKN